MSEFNKLVQGNVGEDVSFLPDLILINDASGSQVVEPDMKVADDVKERLVVGFDHDVPTGTPASSAVYHKLAHFTDNNGQTLIHAKGILYLDVLKRLANPSIVVSTGNHNGIFGCKGSLGLQVSEEELKNLLAGKQITRQVPQSIVVDFTGNRVTGLTSIDIAINVWKRLQEEDIKGKLIYFIDNDNKLNAEDKQVISSMSTLFGAMSSLFIDKEEAADLTIDLSSAKELVILPEAGDKPQSTINVKDADAINNSEFKVGFIGGFTGGNIDDLRLAAKLVENKHIKFGKRLNISPATSDVYVQALNEGLVTKFIDFGAQMVATGDKSVVKQGAGIVGDGEVVMSTGSYNYAGCLSGKTAKIYLGSVKSVINAML